MKRLVFQTALLLLFSMQFDICSAQHKDDIEQIKTCWKPVSLKFMDEGVAMPEIQAKQFMKRVICFDTNYLPLIIDTLIDLKFSAERLETDTHLIPLRLTRKIMGMTTDSITLIDITGENIFTGREVVYGFYYDGRFLYFLEDGALFKLAKCKHP